MNSSKQFLAILVCMLLCLPPVSAQDPRSTAKVGQDLTVIIERQQVRFTAQRDIEQMQLQVFNQSGELIFDGPVTVNQLIWPFQNVYGETIKSGLYAYALSVKEIGITEARARRGHFIVDRAQDRDGATDKLWVTSQNDNGVGTELTVARDENATIAGASAPRREAGKERGEVKRDGDGEAKKGEKTQAELSVSGIGTPGQIAKFISEEEIGGSEITEVEGNVGIGTTTPETKLDVRGHLTLDAGGDASLFTAADGGEQNRFLFLLNSPGYQSASGLKAGGVLVSDNYAFANPGKNDLVVKGSVGIGSPAPESLLHLSASSARTRD